MTAPAQEQPKKPATRRFTRKLGEYTVIGKLGQGAMGEVYEAIQESLQRKVALKVLPEAMAREAEQVERFHREAKAAARLHHPHIVPVYGSGTDAGTHWYAMEFVRGRTLKEIIQDKQNPLRDPRRLAKYLIQVAEALDYAHRAGVIHRDVKPANVLVKEEDDKALIADFGLSRLESARAITREGMLMGTPTYMAPEQAMGEPIDPRIDTWALGVTLYEGLTGVVPFASNDLRDLIVQITTNEPKPVRALRPEVPWELEAIAKKALRKNRDERYQSARDLADDLIKFMRGEVISAAPTPLGLLVAKKLRKHKVAAILGAVLAVVLLVGPIVAVSASRARARDEAAAALANARAAEGKGDIETALAQVNAAYQLLPSPDIDRERIRLSGVLVVQKAERKRTMEEQAARTAQAKERAEREERAGQALARARDAVGAGLEAWHKRYEALARKLAFRSESLVTANVPASKVAETSRAIEEDRKALGRIEDELARVAGEALVQLQAVLALAAPDDPQRGQTQALAQDLLALLRRRAERLGNEQLAQAYAHEATFFGGASAPADSFVSFWIKTDPPARASVTWVHLDGDQRTEGEREDLGIAAPLTQKRVPRGHARACIVELSLEGYATARVPVLAQGGDKVAVAVRLVPRDVVPAGFVHVPAGELFPPRDASAVRPKDRTYPAWVDDFFIGETEVTLGSYLEFVNDADGEGRIARLPARELVKLGTDGKWAPADGRPGEDPKLYPAAGVSYENALAYAAWLSKKSSDRIVYRLPMDDEWEKAATDPLGLAFPWGTGAEAEKTANDRPANVMAEHEPGRLPVRPVKSFPRDRSVHGLWDVTGNVAEWTSDVFAPGIRIVRGGSFARAAEVAHLASREPVDPAQFQAARERYGFRLAFSLPRR